MRRVSLDQTSQMTLEKIARNDAVHPIQNIEELKDRLRSGRRCYALFHPSIPSEPLVIVHAVLLQSIPCSLKDLREIPTDTDIKPRVVAFYSITNACKGLVGLDLGAYLIKSVMDIVQSEYHNRWLDFVTLSPIPGFRQWLTWN